MTRLRKQDARKWNEDDLSTSDWLGEVVDNEDPLKMFRCKVRVWGKLDQIDDDMLPWAYPHGHIFSGSGSGNASVPKKGTIVKVNFLNGDLYAPQYYGIPNMSKKMIEEISATYLDSHIILYDEDEDVKIFYTPGVGLRLYMKGSSLSINKDKTITIEHADSTSIVELLNNEVVITANQSAEISTNQNIEMNSSKIIVNGKLVDIGSSPTYSASLSEPLWIFLKALSTAVDAKWPPSPGAMAGLAQSAELLATSKTVKVSM